MKIIIGLFLPLIFSVSAAAVNYCGGSIKGGDGIPWPWGSEAKFPWKSISGSWQTISGDCKNQFVFKVNETTRGKILQIVQYDPYACKIVGSGVGFYNGRYVTAQMNRGGITYNMTIHAFDSMDVENMSVSSFAPNYSALGKLVTVISLFPVNMWNDRSTYQVVKVEPTTNLVCY
jgi:hypothetical protein